MDLVKERMPDVSIQQLYEEVTRQTLLTSLKELFGAVCIVGTYSCCFYLVRKFGENYCDMSEEIIPDIFSF